MKLLFLGTRGNIEEKTRRHRRHSSLLVSYHDQRVMIDCGADWRDEINELSPDAILITHAHPDHAWGLENGAPCPVYATESAWKSMAAYPIEQRNILSVGNDETIENFQITAYQLEHSTRAPAVGYRLVAGRATIFYAPDVVYIHQRQRALQDIDAYIGDGATVKQFFVRKRQDRLIGHTPIQTQLTWCRKEGVPRAVFTHCGSQIVGGDERRIIPQIQNMAKKRNVRVDIAFDGMELIL